MTKECIGKLGLIGLMTILMSMDGTAFSAPTKTQKRMSQLMPASSEKAAEAGNCASFAGHWVGTCTDSMGGTLEDWLKIEQYDCGSVAIEGEGYIDDVQIGGVFRHGSTSFTDNSNWDVSGGVDWDIARRVLTIRGVGFSKITSVNFTASSVLTSTYALVDGKLQTRDEHKFDSLQNGVPITTRGWEECVFEKQSH